MSAESQKLSDLLEQDRDLLGQFNLVLQQPALPNKIETLGALLKQRSALQASIANCVGLQPDAVNTLSEQDQRQLRAMNEGARALLDHIMANDEVRE